MPVIVEVGFWHCDGGKRIELKLRRKHFSEANGLRHISRHYEGHPSNDNNVPLSNARCVVPFRTIHADALIVERKRDLLEEVRNGEFVENSPKGGFVPTQDCNE